MADLTARFALVDEMSARMTNIAECGQHMVSSWNQAGENANSAFESAARSADSLSNALGNVGNQEAVLDAAAQESFESVYRLNEAMGAAEEAYGSLSQALDDRNFFENFHDDTPRENVEAVANAYTNAQSALEEFSRAQDEASAAMANWDDVMINSSDDLDKISAAGDRASQALANLETAQQNTQKAAEDLNKATEQAGESGDKAGMTAKDAIEAVSNALATAKIYEKVTEISEAVYGLTTAFSEAESVVVTATGATGAALGGLTDSMMDAYAASKTGSLGDTAGAIGEINTRMHLTGEELTEVTEKFLDYADITGSNVVSSVQDVTKVMNKWNVEQSNVESVLDKLAYTAQDSGASVSSLSSAVISGAATYQQLGLSLDNTISMLGELELAGVSASSAMTGMRQAVNNAAEDGVEANTYFLDTIESISNAATETEAAAIAADAFGKRAGQELALAIRSGTISVETFNSTLEEADGTLRKTAEAAQTLDEKWEQSTNNIQAAFTKAVEPTIDKVSSGLANATNKVGDFLNENEALTKGLVAGGVAIGSFVVAMTGIATAVSVAKVAIPLLSGAITGLFNLLGPAGLIAVGVSALAIGIGTFVALSNDGVVALEDMTLSTSVQSDELERLNNEYDKACEAYGETSDQARALKFDLDEATSSFETNAFSVKELYAEIDALHESTAQILESYGNCTKELDEQHERASVLMAKLKQLGSASESTAESQLQMQTVVAELNTMYPNLSLNIDNLNSSLDDMASKINTVYEAESRQAKHEALQESLNDLVLQKMQMEEDLEKAEIAQRAAQKKYLDTFGDGSSWWATIFKSDVALLKGEAKIVQEDLDTANEEEAKLRQDLFALQAQIDEAIADGVEYQSILDGTYEKAISAADATNIAFSSVRADVKSLVEDYYNAYDAAYQSISGQMGLFEQMAISCEISTDEMIAALKSQSEYMKEYGSNLTEAAYVGINEGLIAQLSDGSQESAGYLDAILNKIDELGAGTEEAKAFIDELNNSFVDVAEQKDAFASTVADMETEFSERLSEINVELEDMVGTMNMEDGAAAAAGATIEAYIETIKAGAAGAEDAAALVNAAVSRGLNAEAWDYNEMSARANPTKALVPGHANGTTNAEDIFVAGENGPELIVGAQGSTVFPTDETDRIIAAIGSRPFNIMPSSTEYSAAAENAPSHESYKRISIEITGAGAITVDRSADREQILNVMTENIEPVLLDIIQKEMFEEGEGSYDF